MGVDFPPFLCYGEAMNKTNNVYAQQVLAQGRDLSNKPADLGEFPKTVYGRTFETREEYLEAIHEFMNGM